MVSIYKKLFPKKKLHLLPEKPIIEILKDFNVQEGVNMNSTFQGKSDTKRVTWKTSDPSV